MAVVANGGGGAPAPSGITVSAVPAYNPPGISAVPDYHPPTIPNKPKTTSPSETAAKQEFKEQLEAQGFKTDKLDYQWEIEKQQVAKQVTRDMSLESCFGPPPITESQAQKAIWYYGDLNQPGKVEDIKEYYTFRSGVGGPLGQVERAADIGYGPFDKLEPYKTAQGYDLVGALEDKAVTKLELMGFFSDAEIAKVGALLSTLTKLERGGFGSREEGFDVAGAIAAGTITKGQAEEVFGKKEVEKACSGGSCQSVGEKEYLATQLGREPTWLEFQSYRGLERPSNKWYSVLQEAGQILWPGKQSWDVYRAKEAELYGEYLKMYPNLKLASIPEVFELGSAPLPGAKLIPERVWYPQISWADIPKSEIAKRVGITAIEIAAWTAPKWIPPVARKIGLVSASTKPAGYAPFPKESIAYGPGNRVLVNLGGKYGWLPYEDALVAMQTDVGFAKMYQPPYAFGATGTFYPKTQPMVLGSKVYAPPLQEAGVLLRYPELGAINLAKTPYYPPIATTRTLPGYYYPDTTGPSPWTGTVPITGTKVYGEIPGMAPIQSLSLGGLKGIPVLPQGPVSYGMPGQVGWAPYKLTTVPQSLEPYTFSGWGGPTGGSRYPLPLAPTRTPIGSLTSLMPSTQVLTQLGTKPSPIIGAPAPVIFPGYTPVTTPGPAVFPTPYTEPFVIPGVKPALSYPELTPVIIPYSTPITRPSPYPQPFVTPPITPPITPTLTPIYTPPGGWTTPPPPLLVPSFGGSLGFGWPRGTRKGKALPVGEWKFRGYPVGGVHPLTGRRVQYTYMKGRTTPYGIKRTKKKGMVRIYKDIIGV